MSAADPKTKIRFGFASNPKKMKNFMEPFVQYARQQGVDFVQIDLEENVDIDQQPSVDILFQKCTDDMVQAIAENSRSSQIHVANLRKYIDRQSKLNSEFIVVEGLSDIAKLLDRANMYQLLERACASLGADDLLKCSPHVVINKDAQDSARIDADPQGYVQELLQQNPAIQFPLVCKTLVACGSKNSHIMAIIFNQEGLLQLLSHKSTRQQHSNNSNNDNYGFLNEPVLLQHYVNHNSVVYKVFVIGNETRVFARPSLRNIYASDQSANYILFNSQHELPEGLRAPPMSQEELIANMPSSELIARATKAICDTIGLKLLGYDIITDCETKQNYVIDANYLPSYRGWPEVYRVLLRYLLGLKKQQ